MAHWSLDLLAKEPGTFGDWGGFWSHGNLAYQCCSHELGFGKLLRAVPDMFGIDPIKPSLIQASHAPFLLDVIVH